MKLKLTRIEPKFTPVKLEITFTSQEELDCFKSIIGNISPVNMKNAITDNERKDFNSSLWGEMSIDIYNELDYEIN